MATKRFFEIKVDQVATLADRIGSLDASALSKATSDALNSTVDTTYELARKRITADVNIADDYLRRRMEVDHATPTKNSATITATGDPKRMTRLAHYQAQMVVVPRKTTTPSRAKGSILNLGPGVKQGGVKVNVMRPAHLGSAFMLPLKAGNAQGEKLGVFIRDGKRLKHLYGPSVYQLFRYQAEQLNDEVAEDLRENLLAQVSDQIKGALG